MNQTTTERTFSPEGYIYVAIAASGWGLWPLILHHAPVPLLIQATIAIAVPTIVTAPICYFPKTASLPTNRQKAALAAFGFSDLIGLLCFFGALRLTTVPIAVLTHYLSTFLLPIATIALRIEKPRIRTFTAVTIALTGLVMLLSPWNSTIHSHDLAGAALGSTSAIFSTGNILLTKRLARSLAPTQLMFYHGLAILPALLIAIPLITDLSTVTAKATAVVTLGALGPGTIGVIFFFSGLKRIPASHTGVLTLLEPFVAILIAMFFMNEPHELFTLTGGLLILAGAIIVIEPFKKPTPTPESRSHTAVPHTQPEAL